MATQPSLHAQSLPMAPIAPIAKKIPKTLTLHGDRREDPYFWLRKRTNPAVIDYLNAENAYTQQVMLPTAPLQAQLYSEMLARMKETDEEVPLQIGDYLYYSRTVQGQQYALYCRKKRLAHAADHATNAKPGPEQVLLDLNELAKGSKFLEMGEYDLSPNHHWLAYSLDTTGFREYTLHIKNLISGEVLPERIAQVDSTAWAADNKTLFYVIENSAKRPYRLYRHELGSAKPDQLIYEESDEAFTLSVSDSRSQAYIFITSQSSESSEVRYLSTATPTAALQLVTRRRQNHEYFVDHHIDDFYIITNDQGRNNRLVKAPTHDPRPAQWREVVAHRPLVMLEGVDVFKRHMVLHERERGTEHLRLWDFASGDSHRIAFDEPIYSAGGAGNPEFDTDIYRLSLQSYVTPDSIYDYHIATRVRALKKQQPVLGGFNHDDYASETIAALAKDGTEVSVSMVYNKRLRTKGSATPQPLLLYGYGSYGIPMDVSFSASRLSLLDRGVIFATAHIRGGGDQGRLWHDAGKMRNKKNTFTDFISAAEALIAQRYTSANQLIIQGGSAGGLLMGVVTNWRPDLFKAVVTQVPFVDVLSTMLDSTLPLTVGEYLEWGNPNLISYYRLLRSYSPYDNLKKMAYPAMLVETSLHDSQVMYWEPAKYVAKLRTLKTNDTPLLLQTNMDAGHGGASGRYDYLNERAFTYAFMLKQWGLDDTRRMSERSSSASQ